MPNVPVYQPGQVQRSNLPGVRLTGASPSEMGAGIGQGLASIAGVTNQLATRERERADQIALLDAENEYGAAETDLLFGPKGAMQSKGKDAFGVHDSTMPALRKRSGEIEARLRSPDVKAQFRARVQSRQTDTERQLYKHVAGEAEQFDAQQSAAAVLQNRERAISSYNDPVIVGAALEEQRRVITERAARAGEPPELTQQKILDAQSQTHERIIGQMVDHGRYTEARTHFAANAENLTADARDRAGDLVRVGTVKAESQAAADRILAGHSSEAAALKAARQIEDPDVRDATEQRVRQGFGDRLRVKREAQADAVDRASQIIEQTGDINAIPATTLQLLDSSQISALEQRSRQKKEGIEPAQDWAKWYAFSQMPPEQQESANLMTTLRPYVDDAHFNQAVALQQAIKEGRRGGKDAASLVTSTLTFKDRLGNTVQQAGLFKKVSGLTGSQAGRYAQFESEASRRVEQMETSLGRKATGTEMQEVIDEMVMRRVFVNEWGGDPEKLIIELTDDEAAAAYVPIDRVPEAERMSLSNYTQSIGRPVTKDKIQRAYAAALQGNRDAMLEIMKE